MLDVSDLHMVESICQTRSITQAAESLHISQPTLSKRLARRATWAPRFSIEARGVDAYPNRQLPDRASAAIKAQVSSVGGRCVGWLIEMRENYASAWGRLLSKCSYPKLY